MPSQSNPSAFSIYASRFLAGDSEPQQQIFRPASPSSPSHDPFLASPSTSSRPHLPGSSRSPSPSSTPPFPGASINDIPDIHDSDSNLGELFIEPSTQDRSTPRPSVPNPYAASTSSEDELEPDLADVAELRQQRLPVNRERGDKTKRGWMAHQSVFPPSSSSSDSESDKETEDDSDSEGPNLNEPLLQPGDTARPERVPIRLHLYHGKFGHWEREGLRKYKDAPFLALWLASLLGLLIGLCFVWGSTDAPVDAPRSRPSLIPLLPLLFILIIPAIALPPAFLFMLRRTVRPVLLATAIAIPFSLFICGWWALGASFEQFDAPDTWWGTTGLRIGALILWLVSAGFGWLVWVRRHRLAQTATVVELSTSLLLNHPPLLLLTPLLLSVFAVMSIPFLTMLIRLGTIGYWRHPRENTWVFHIRPYAGWLMLLVTILWIWTWSVVKGAGRVAVAGVVGEWYFHRHEPSFPAPLELTTAAVHRATGTSLGSVCLGAGITTTLRAMGRSAAELKRLSRSKAIPTPLAFVSTLTPVFAMVAGILDQINGFALIYVGITGDPFWQSARKAVALTSRKQRGKLLDYTLIKLLLTLSSTAMGLFTGTAGYLYMSHSLVNPSYAPLAALLCGGVPFLAIRAGAAVLGDAADSLFICHQIDSEINGQHCIEAKEAFSYRQGERTMSV